MFQDPICRYPGCLNPTGAYANVASALASSVRTRLEARCVEHGARPLVFPLRPAAREEGAAE